MSYCLSMILEVIKPNDICNFHTLAFIALITVVFAKRCEGHKCHKRI